MKTRLLKTLSLLFVILFSNFYYSQNTTSAEVEDSVTKRIKKNAIVIEGLGKTWGGSISYEYKLHPKFSGGIGIGTSPVFYRGKVIGVGYGIVRAGKNRNHFVTSAGLMFSKKNLKPKSWIRL